MNNANPFLDARREWTLRDTGDEPRPSVGDHPEYAQASALADARAMLARAILAEPEGFVAGLRVVEAGVHRGRVSRRALLLERPTPRWVQSAMEALHEEAGCWRQPVRGLAEPNLGLAGAMARLPWSGEWLVRVGETLPHAATARIQPLEMAWVARRNAFVESHRRLIVAVVRRRSRPSRASHEDLLQEAFLGLCRAVERYDPGRGTRFSSYAVPVIRRAIGHAIRNIGEAPTAPHGLSHEAAARIPLRYRGSAGLRRARRRSPALVSLDAAVDALDDATTLAERLADPDVVPVDVAVINAIECARLRDALGAVPNEIRDILVLRWGLAGEPPWSVPQIGQHVGRDASEVHAIIDGSRGGLQAALNRAQPPALRCTQNEGVRGEVSRVDL